MNINIYPPQRPVTTTPTSFSRLRGLVDGVIDICVLSQCAFFVKEHLFNGKGTWVRLPNMPRFQETGMSNIICTKLNRYFYNIPQQPIAGKFSFRARPVVRKMTHLMRSENTKWVAKPYLCSYTLIGVEIVTLKKRCVEK